MISDLCSCRCLHFNLFRRLGNHQMDPFLPPRHSNGPKGATLDLAMTTLRSILGRPAAVATRNEPPVRRAARGIINRPRPWMPYVLVLDADPEAGSLARQSLSATPRFLLTVLLCAWGTAPREGPNGAAGGHPEERLSRWCGL